MEGFLTTLEGVLAFGGLCFSILIGLGCRRVPGYGPGAFRD